MAEVLAASLAFPAVIFTVALALALIYWLFVLLGAVDLDLLGGAHGHAAPDLGGLEGAAKGALEGAAKGSLEGAVKGSLEGAAKGSLEGAATGTADGAGGAEDAGSLLAALQLHRVPATVSLTLIAAFGWFTSALSTVLVEPLWLGWGLPRWTLGVAVLAGSLAAAVLSTSLAVRPLGPLFVTRHGQSKKDLVGRVCVISTGRVDERFGQATIDEGGASHILDVRCDTPGALRRGDRALLVSWDPDREIFSVEPLDALLGTPPPLAERGASRVEARPAGVEEDDAPAARAADERQRRG
ncbi:glycine zipper family protein [Sorangium sp. So ce302]|uniref:glycine zipper family protein n=1 Tax=Sorangium sp. So ce302 TaxID=3133297 RepID=UPI003F5D75C1